MKTRPHNRLFATFSAKLRTLSILFFTALFSVGALAQLCATSVVPPAVVNGVTVTSTSTGGVGTYPTAFTSCAYTTPANSMYFGFGGAFTYTFLFSQPVNNVVFVMTAAGQPGNEEFTITTNSGIPTIVDLGSCFTTIVGNTIFSGLGSGPMGGGGIFEIVGTGSYTSLTISGPGGLAGSLFALCENSVVPNPSGITSTDASCFGACDGTADIVPGNLPPYSYLWDAAAGNSTSSSMTGLCAGTYTVQVTDGAGTVEVLSVTIDQPTQVQGTVTAQTNVLCAGNTTGSVTISASGGTGPYSYNIGSGPSASGTFSGLAAGNYTVTVLDAEGCSATVPITITEPAPLTLTLVNQNNPSCAAGTNGSIEVQANGGTGAYTYTLNGASASASGLYQNLAAGSYTLSVTDANACVVAATVAVTLTDPAPIIGTIDSQTPTTCFGDTDGSVIVSASGGNGALSYDIGGGAVANGAFSGLTAGTYNITITDAGGCTTVVPVTITEPIAVMLNLVSQTNPSCPTDTDGSLEVLAVGGTAGYTYTINGGTPSTSGLYQNLSAATYILSATDVNGCTASSTISVTLDEPTPISGNIASQTNVSCFGDADGNVNIGASGGTGALTFDIGQGAGVSGIFSGLSAGNYTITIADAVGCSTTIPVSITEPTQLTLNLLNQTDATCPSNDNGSIEVQANGGTVAYTYTLNGGAASASGLYQNLIPGTYTLSVTDFNGCSASADFTLIGSPLIAAMETVVNEWCAGDCNGSIDIVPSQGTAPFSFSIDNCTTLLPSGSFTDLCAGTYAICVVDANGCLYNTTAVVGTENPASDPTMTPIGPLCLNDDPVAIDAVDAGVFSGNGVVGTTFIPQLAGPGTHTITNLVNANCGGVATMDIIVYPLPTVSFEADVVSGCSPLTVAFTSTGDPVVSYQWSFGDGFHPDNSATVDYTFVEPGYYDVLLIATDVNGCTNSADYSNYIHALEDPIADFSFDPSKPTTMNPLVSFNNLSSGATQWEWTFDTLGTATTAEPTFTFPDETAGYMITLVAISPDGCSDTIRKPLLIHPEPLVFVPNTFTPDGNEFNQIFSPSIDGIDSYHYHLTIFNRWGELIFESFDPALGWDGTYKGRVVQEGNYNWHIVLDEIYSATRTEFYGTVLLMR